MKWLAKRKETLDTWDENGNKLTSYAFNGYDLKGKTTSNQKPSAQYDIIEGPDIPREHAKVQQDIDGNWEVVEDVTLKSAEEAREAKISTAKSSLKSINWTNVSDFNKLKAVVKNLVDQL